MKYTVHIVYLMIVFAGCQQTERSLFFKDCECEKIDFRNGITFSDSLGHYSVKYPNSSWLPVRNLDENGNGVTGIDTLIGYWQIAAVTEIKKSEDWPGEEESMKKIEEEFNVLEKGYMNYQNKKCHWHVMKFDTGALPVYTLYLQITKNDKLYTLNMSIEQGENYRQKLCRLESFIDHFTIY